MKAVISTTYSDTYLFFLPITTWCWNKLGVDVICFLPLPNREHLSYDIEKHKKWGLISDTIENFKGHIFWHFFYCPEHKEATYAQCSRLYAAAKDLSYLKDGEALITGDADMIVFDGIKNYFSPNIPEKTFIASPEIYKEVYNRCLKIIGHDLVPKDQYPICYAMADVTLWRRFMNICSDSDDTPIYTYQEKLDHLLGGIECDNMRGNYWGKDQETLFNHCKDSGTMPILLPRARPATMFAENRVDRDDINWRSYCGPNLVDAHLWRPGYTDENFANILELLQTQYPNEDFTWLFEYRRQYLKLL